MGKVTFAPVGPNVPPPPANAIMPLQWYAIVLWQRGSDWEVGRRFETRIGLVSAGGALLTEGVASWEFQKNANSHSILNVFNGCPIGDGGPLKVKLWNREQTNPPKEWKEIATFPIEIEFKKADSPPT